MHHIKAAIQPATFFWMRLSLLSVLLVCSCCYGQLRGSIEVKITNGTLIGSKFENAFYSFLGVPFAAAPIGNNRWRDPQPSPGWRSHPLNATQYAPGCPQKCILPPESCPQVLSEDCLFLNVYGSIESSASLLPVMVWLPGGHFDQGGAEESMYSALEMVRQHSVVLVEVSYRLGAFGWLATDEIKGNFGYEDQLLALRWVQENIWAFGGNASHVTLYGQSAGATSVAYHMVSERSRGFFHAAIIESNPWSLPLRDVKTAQKFGKKVMRKLGCKDLRCAMNKTAAQVVAADVEAEGKLDVWSPFSSFYPYTPLLGLPGGPTEQPVRLFARGEQLAVPLLLGSTSNESSLFIHMAFPKGVSKALYLGFLADAFPGHFFRILSQYPAMLLGDIADTMSLLGTDYIFTCPARYIARATGAHRYLYSHVNSFAKARWGPHFPFCWDKACRAAELPILFRPLSAELQSLFSLTPAEVQLSAGMMQRWAAFATNHSASWPSGNTTLILDTPITQQEGGFHRCDLWDALDIYK